MNKVNKFNSLLKDTTNNTINNVNRISSNNFQTNRFFSRQINEERNIKKQTANFIKSLDSLTDFPELQIKKTELNNLNNNQNKTNYLDIIKINNITKNEETNIDHDNDDKNISSGCVCIKYDKKTKQLVWLYGENTYNANKDINSDHEEDNSFDTIQRVVDVYNNRKIDYINKWGKDEYDKMFLFQNYDYNYFDKLDEKYNNV
jgi:hypothetical protein